MRLLAAPTEADVARLAADCADLYGGSVDAVRVIRAPYRICPLGAHIDHQLGTVSAVAVDQGILAAFRVTEQPWVELTSDGYPETVRVPLEGPLTRAHDWADYARGAVAALRGRASLSRGVSLLVRGHLGEAGLSSSAAVGLGYLLALAMANDIELDDDALIELDRQIENGFMGLDNGVLDPAAIVRGRPDQLTLFDCATLTGRHVAQAERFVFLAFFSGFSEGLVSSGKFNDRVAECRQAGARLWERVHGERVAACPLGRLTEADWLQHGDALPEVLRRRAEHFFGESRRVHAGAKAWAASDHAEFGRLMTESGSSSISCYETGGPEMMRLYEILNACPGVWGARFSGAGFRGCAVALVRPEQVDAIALEVNHRYLAAFPQYSGRTWAFASSARQGLECL